MSNEIWHAGELAVQQRAGSAELMEKVGSKFIRPFMPPQHRDFFQSLSMIFIGYQDHCAVNHANLFFGDSHFIHSPSETELQINTQYSLDNMNNNQFNIGDRIGLLGIEFATKRRNRLNAIITDITQKQISLRVLQSFGNCHKYIANKQLSHNPLYGKTHCTTHHVLNEEDQRMIRESDQCFIVSSFDDGQASSNRGVDISHRGGPRGFVRIINQGTLEIDDYPGNGFFNTFGNIQSNPNTSLLFVDWQRGHALRLETRAQILWHDQAQTPSTPAAQRQLQFNVQKIERLHNASAYRQSSQ